MVAVLSAGLAAQDAVGLAGAWTVNGMPWGARVAAPGGFPVMLVIRASDGSVGIQRNGGPVEDYRLDGVPTPLPDGRLATARFENGVLTLAIARTRVARGSEPYTLTARERYHVTGDTLTLERSYLVEGGRASESASPVQTVSYRRN